MAEVLEMLVDNAGGKLYADAASRSWLDEEVLSFNDMVSTRRGGSRLVRDVVGVSIVIISPDGVELGASPLAWLVEDTPVEVTRGWELSAPRKLLELSLISFIAGSQRVARLVRCSCPCRTLTPIKVPTSKLVPNQ
jgi:hypothetical protein